MELKLCRARILIVDDEVDFMEPISYWFTSQGYEISKVNNGKAALDIIKKGEHDIVLLDVNMPEMDGIETLRRVRAIDKTIPVILVTAVVDDENRFSGARALGIAGFFPKGGSLVQLGDLLDVSLHMLRKREKSGKSTEDSVGLMRWFKSVRQFFDPSYWKNHSPGSGK